MVKEPRIIVKVYLEIPVSMYQKLSKRAIRSKKVTLWGADWNSVTLVPVVPKGVKNA